MRVLHIIAGQLFGGVETMLTTLARFREACPEMVTDYAVCFEGRLRQELAAAGAAVHVLGEVRTRYPYTVWRARRRLRDLLRYQRFDVVVCHMPWAHAIFAPVVRSEAVPLVFQAHGPATGRHWLERWAALTRPDLVVCLSQFLVDNVTKIFPAVPVELVYNPVAPVRSLNRSERLAARAEANTAEDAVVIIQACRMDPGKGHGVCLEALALLRDLPGWECWQVGGPQRPQERAYFENLRAQAAQLGVGKRVRFWGQRTDVPRLLAAADIYCQPNDTFLEGLPNVFVEAMRARLPIVTTTCIGAVREVIDESCGVLLPPGDVGALAATLTTLIGDSSMRARLGAGGVARADAQFAPAVQIPKLCEALRKAVPLGCASDCRTAQTT